MHTTCQVVPKILQEFCDALVQTMEEFLQDTVCGLIRSMHQHCQACIQPHKGNRNQ